MKIIAHVGNKHAEKEGGLIMHLTEHEVEVICRHKEVIERMSTGLFGTCKECGQERVYPTTGRPRIIKRGIIDGKVTMIVPPKITEQETEYAER